MADKKNAFLKDKIEENEIIEEALSERETDESKIDKVHPIVINQDVLAKMSDREKRILFASLLGFVSTQIAIMEGVQFNQPNQN